MLVVVVEDEDASSLLGSISRKRYESKLHFPFSFDGLYIPARVFRALPHGMSGRWHDNAGFKINKSSFFVFQM